MYQNGLIAIESGSKGLSYLRELLINDGPEYCYTVVFWEKDDPAKKVAVLRQCELYYEITLFHDCLPRQAKETVFPGSACGKPMASGPVTAVRSRAHTPVLFSAIRN